MLVQTSPPAAEPISLAEARLHLKLVASDSTDEDSLIDDILIPAARRYAEAFTRRSFVTQSWRLVLDSFPRCIELEKGPVSAITSLTYRDMAGDTQTVSWVAASNSIQRSTDGTLIADLSGDVATITPAFGCTWPIAMPEAGAIAVSFTAGYGAAGSDVPEGIRSWMLLRINSLFENREEAAAGVVSPMPWVDGLLDPYVITLA